MQGQTGKQGGRGVLQAHRCPSLLACCLGSQAAGAGNTAVRPATPPPPPWPHLLVCRRSGGGSCSGGSHGSSLLLRHHLLRGCQLSCLGLQQFVNLLVRVLQ